MTRKTIKEQKGFTLLEIVVSLIVASILGSMLLVYVGTAYKKSVEPVTTSKRILQLEGKMEEINAIYAGLLNKGDVLDSLNTEILKTTFPTGMTYTPKRFTFPVSGLEPTNADPAGNVMKVVLKDTTIKPNLELIALFYSRR